MKDYCIINVAINSKKSPWFAAGQDRLNKTLDLVGYDGDRLFWKNEYPPNSLTHDKAPYAFKIAAIKEAQRRGYKKIIYADASIMFIRNPMPMFEYIEKEKYMVFVGGESAGTWASDKSLENLKVSRNDAFKMYYCVAGFIGFDLTDMRVNNFLDLWDYYAHDGSTFIGDWTNEHKQVSTNPMVKGHRHDQTAATILLYRLGMRKWISCFTKENGYLYNNPDFEYNWWFKYWYGEKIERDDVVVLCRGDAHERGLIYCKKQEPTKTEIQRDAAVETTKTEFIQTATNIGSQKYSQKDEQFAIVPFFDRMKSTRRFLDIGSWWPDTFSNVRALADKGWSGVCVEPSPNPFNKLFEYYKDKPNVKLENVAIYHYDGEADFYATDDALSTFSENHVKRWKMLANVPFQKIKVKTMTIKSLFDKHGKDFSFINIDAEGYSIEILKQLNFIELSYLRMLCIEHNQQIPYVLSLTHCYGFRILYQNDENLIICR